MKTNGILIPLLFAMMFFSGGIFAQQKPSVVADMMQLLEDRRNLTAGILTGTCARSS